MALIDSIRTTADALEELASWANDYTAVADPLRRAARVLASMAAKLAKVLETQAMAVQQVSNRMSVVNDIQKQVIEGITNIKNQGDDTTERRWLEGTEEELQFVMNVLVAEGVSTSLFANAGGRPSAIGGGRYELVITGRNLATVQSVLSSALEAMSSTSQSDQARTQTTMGRYNACFDLVTNLLRKSETQGDAVSTNMSK